MAEYDDTGKNILTEDDIEFLEDKGVNLDDPEEVRDAIELYNDQRD